MSKLTHHIECSKFNSWIVRNLNKQLVYIGLSRSDAIKWAFSQNKENRKGDKTESADFGIMHKRQKY
tara:strand:+ start:493 stop:693 length:201 start_codon:yes stop_codon:yes gene_type:complete